jgi:ribosome maturation factor RimP
MRLPGKYCTIVKASNSLHKGVNHMAMNRRLEMDKDFKEAMERGVKVRVFKNDHMIESGGVIIRFDENSIVLQSSVSDLGYHPRNECEFFEMKKR